MTICKALTKNKQPCKKKTRFDGYGFYHKNENVDENVDENVEEILCGKYEKTRAIYLLKGEEGEKEENEDKEEREGPICYMKDER